MIQKSRTSFPVKWGIFCLLLLMGMGLSAQDRRALVVGNSNYSHSPLLNPVNDARDLGTMLGDLGFEVTFVLDATRSQLYASIRDFEDTLVPGGDALFFYAGHGLQLDGVNYLVPVDADIRSPEDALVEAIPMERVLASMESQDQENVFVILDACRDNPFLRSRGGSRGLSVVQTQITGTFVAFATSPGDVADDGDGRNSPFTRALLAHLPTPELSVEEMFRNVKRDVNIFTQGRQTPWTSSSMIQAFYFNPEDSLIPRYEDLVSRETSQLPPVAPEVGDLELVLASPGEITLMDRVFKLDAGTHQLTALPAGYQPILVAYSDGFFEVRSVEIFAGRQSVLVFPHLTPDRSGSIEVSLASPAQLQIFDRQLDLGAGTHIISGLPGGQQRLTLIYQDDYLEMRMIRVVLGRKVLLNFEYFPSP